MEPISEPPDRSGIFYGGVALFALLYLGLAVALGPRLYRNVLSFVTWDAVSCRILESRLVSHGDTFSLEVTYEYTVDGTSHRSTRYEFVESSSNLRGSWERAHAALPSGHRTTCWVNPHDPTDAVLSRRFSFWYSLLLLPPFAFVAFYARRLSKKLRPAPAIADATVAPPLPVAAPPAASVPAGEAAALEPKLNPNRSFTVNLASAIILTAVSAAMIVFGAEAVLAGRIPWWAVAIMSLFPLLALNSIVSTIWAALALRNPRVRLTITSTDLPLGSSASVGWTFEGATDALSKVRIVLRGKEWARRVESRPHHLQDQQGPSTQTIDEEREFATIPIYESLGSTVSAVGSATFQVPADTMHTFTSPHGRIFWTLEFRGEIARWPDVLEEYEIVVWPAEAEGEK
jgi:hypothetical protein